MVLLLLLWYGMVWYGMVLLLLLWYGITATITIFFTIKEL